MNKLDKFIIFSILLQWEQILVAGRSAMLLKSNYFAVFNEVVAGLLSCNKNYKTILVHDNSEEIIMKSLRNLQPVTVILESYKLFENNEDVTSNQKIDSFIIISNSIRQLKTILISYKKSKFWSITTTVFILNAAKDNCKNAFNFLKTSWEVNIVTAFFICFIFETTPIIYTYNPYSNRKILQWQQIKSMKTNRNSYWSLHSLPFYDKITCNNLHFDRTKHLDGTMIHVGQFEDKNVELRGKDDHKAHFEEVFESTLNISLIYPYPSEKNPDDNVDFALHGSVDLLFNGLDPNIIGYIGNNDAFDFTYHMMYSADYILSHPRGYQSPIKKIFHFYGTLMITFTLFILFITFIVIFFTSQKRLSFAAFEVVRLLTNTSLYTHMNSLSLRIFFTLIFFYFIIIQATFQGHLAKFLTKPEYEKNIDSVDDLRMDSAIGQINALVIMNWLYDDPELDKKVNLIRLPYMESGPSCIENVIKNTAAVCIDDFIILINAAINWNLYLSKNPISTVKYYSFLTRKDWPLKERVNNILMWLEHAGLSDIWAKKLTIQKTIYQRLRSEGLSDHIRPIDLDALTFAFKFLTIGLICAALCFCCELLISQTAKVAKIIQHLKQLRIHFFRIFAIIWGLCFQSYFIE